MKLILVLLASSVATIRADSCDASFGNFLNALKTELEKNERDQEVEFRDDYKRLVQSCFDSSQGGKKCFLSATELDGDVYGKDGPLQNCARCQTLVKGVRDKYFNSQEKDRKCLRGKLAEAISDELGPCIRNKLGDLNFKVPGIPDFDEKSFANIDIIEKAIDNRIMANSRLDACSSMNKPKYDVTNPCMTKGLPNMYQKHCQAAIAAKATAAKGCNDRFAKVKLATCQCMDEKRKEWHSKLDSIQTIVSKTADKSISGSDCSTQIQSTIGLWQGKLEDALRTCLPGQQNGGGLGPLISLGCSQVAGGGIGQKELTTGFRFIRLFLDALNDRITVFCTCNF